MGQACVVVAARLLEAKQYLFASTDQNLMHTLSTSQYWKDATALTQQRKRSRWTIFAATHKNHWRASHEHSVSQGANEAPATSNATPGFRFAYPKLPGGESRIYRRVGDAGGSSMPSMPQTFLRRW